MIGYFENQYQGMPSLGYTDMITNMLSHENIKIKFNTTLSDINMNRGDTLIYTGGFDGLPYRSTKFTIRRKNKGKYAVVNTPQHPTQTRYTNFNVLHPKNGIPTGDKHVYCYETPAEINEFNQLYPIETKENILLYNNKKDEFLSKYPNAILLGRLATYKYFDMDKVIKQVLDNL